MSEPARPSRRKPRRKPDPPRPVIFARNLVEAWWLRIAYPTAQVHDASPIVAWRRR